MHCSVFGIIDACVQDDASVAPCFVKTYDMSRVSLEICGTDAYLIRLRLWFNLSGLRSLVSSMTGCPSSWFVAVNRQAARTVALQADRGVGKRYYAMERDHGAGCHRCQSESKEDC
jgi:hypothetical protein